MSRPIRLSGSPFWQRGASASAPAPGIEAFCRDAEAAAAARLAGEEVADLAEIRDWRAAYRAFGSKKTSYRNSCEALLRRIKAGQGLPRVLPLVDLYNGLSITHLVPAGADDLARVVPPNAFRYARPGDSFLDLARDPPVDDPPFDERGGLRRQREMPVPPLELAPGRA